MKNKKPTVTIGIPAYNEEANIKNLLEALLEQKSDAYELDEIIVVSDESTDKTDELVLSIKDEKVRLIRNTKRIGGALSQNVIIENFDSDILVIFDADILPVDTKLIEELIKPFSKNEKVGVVSGDLIPLPPKTFIGKVLQFSVELKKTIYKSINGGDNIYLCHGAVRAFSSDFLKTFEWKATYGEDAFSYLACKSKGFDFIYVPEAKVNYQLPANLKDHLKQSTRFFNSQKKMLEYYEEPLVNASYEMPLKSKLRAVFKYLLKNPFYFLSYLGIVAYSRLVTLLKKNPTSATWETSKSSKLLADNTR